MILHKPRSKLQESTRALETKRTDVGSKQRKLKEYLDNLRAEYETNRKRAIDRQGLLKAKLDEFKTNTPDDALDIRNQICQELSRAVVEAIGRLSEANAKMNVASKAESIQ
jgi:hypothetical protein